MTKKQANGGGCAAGRADNRVGERYGHGRNRQVDRSQPGRLVLNYWKENEQDKAEMRTSIAVVGLVAALVAAIGLLAACGSSASLQTTEPPQETQSLTSFPASDGAALVQERCTVCHSVGNVTRARKTRERWEQTIVWMVDMGAQLNEDEQTILIEHLAETYGP